MKHVFVVIALLFCTTAFYGCRDHDHNYYSEASSSSKKDDKDTTTITPDDPAVQDPPTTDLCELLVVEVKDCYRLGEGVLTQIRDGEDIGCFEFDVDILDKNDAFTIGIRKDWKSLSLIRLNYDGATILFQSIGETFETNLQPVEINLTKKELRHYRLGVELCYKPDHDEHDHRNHDDCSEYDCDDEDNDHNDHEEED